MNLEQRARTGWNNLSNKTKIVIIGTMVFLLVNGILVPFTTGCSMENVSPSQKIESVSSEQTIQDLYKEVTECPGVYIAEGNPTRIYLEDFNGGIKGNILLEENINGEQKENFYTFLFPPQYFHAVEGIVEALENEHLDGLQLGFNEDQNGTRFINYFAKSGAKPFIMDEGIADVDVLSHGFENGVLYAFGAVGPEKDIYGLFTKTDSPVLCAKWKEMIDKDKTITIKYVPGVNMNTPVPTINEVLGVYNQGYRPNQLESLTQSNS